MPKEGYRQGMTPAEMGQLGRSLAARANAQVRKTFNIEGTPARNFIGVTLDIPIHDKPDKEHINPYHQRIVETGAQSCDYSSAAEELVASKKIMETTEGPDGKPIHLKPIRPEYGVIDLSNVDRLIEQYTSEGAVLIAERKIWISRAEMAGYDISQYVEKEAKKAPTISGQPPHERTNGHADHTNGNGHNGHAKEDLGNYTTTTSATEEKNPAGSLK